MVQITAQMVKELRAATGAGPRDCKNILTETEGDVQKAIEMLKAKGIAKAEKKLDSGRPMNEGKIDENAWERAYYEMALKCSGAVQARRWTQLSPQEGYIYSFNGPHSLFIDTIRTVRSLVVAYGLGHEMKTENDRAVSLLERLLMHVATTAKYAVYYGEGRDTYDVRGRVAHESVEHDSEIGSSLNPYLQQ